MTLELDLEAAQTQWLTLLIATQVPTTAAIRVGGRQGTYRSSLMGYNQAGA